MSQKKLKHIELFAGCGGMALGLDKAGFDLYFANEMSPMAGETFAYNILNEDLFCKAEKEEPADNVKWIKSSYPVNELSSRLRESPFTAKKGDFSDLRSIEDLKGKLLIGDVDDLLYFLMENPQIVSEIKGDDIDVLSGGPPCQSFSLAGKREKNNHKNLLPLSFAKFAGLIQPKVVLLENVKGITSPFTEEGKKYYAWLEVAKAFVLEGFVPVCMMINSKYFGVAQNRPRYIMYAFRKDIFEKVKKQNKESSILKSSSDFYHKVTESICSLEKVTVKNFQYYDIENLLESELFDGVLLPEISHKTNEFVTVADSIGDLRRTDVLYKSSSIKSKYGKDLLANFPYRDNNEFEIKNHDARQHSFPVKARFRFYQVINQFQNGLKKGAIDLFSGNKIEKDMEYRLKLEFSKYNLYFRDDEGEFYKKPNDINEVETLLKSIPTKKHSQRALQEYEPAPAQLTIPDDLCHYNMESLRTLTVREMARFQSFPDWYEFRSKVTTGGTARKYEVPQYTQVGNAVPPLLALSLGEVVFKVLNSVQNRLKVQGSIKKV